MIELRTDRLIIRSVSYDLALALYDELPVPELKFEAGYPFTTRTFEAAGRVVTGMAEADGLGMFLLIRAEDGSVIGDCSVERLPREPENTVWISAQVVDGIRGHRYGSEALKALGAWARAHQGVDRVLGEIDQQNEASILAAARAGFVPTGEKGGRVWEWLPPATRPSPQEHG